MTFRISLLCLSALTFACGSDNSGAAGGAGSAGSGSSSGTSSTSAGAATGGAPSAGAPSGGAPSSPGGGQAGSGQAAAAASLSPAELRDATYVQCSKGCTFIHAACPATSTYEGCSAQCRLSADVYFASGKCGVEFYEAFSCIGSLTAADVTCVEASPVLHGCLNEQARYNACKG